MTAYARLKLYTYIEGLQDRVIYFDTDSVVYIELAGQYNPPIGVYLGDMTDELDGGEITEFVSGGPKVFLSFNVSLTIIKYTMSFYIRCTHSTLSKMAKATSRSRSRALH